MQSVMKQKYYYKAVKVFNNKYYSANPSIWMIENLINCGDISSNDVLEYPIKKFTKPKIKGSKLFVFNNFRKAFSWAGYNSEMVIFKCLVKNPEEPKFMYVSRKSNCYDEYWEKYNEGVLPEDEIQLALTGTIFADEVKLISEVRSKKC